MGPEDVVVQEVVRYFSTPRFERFSKAKEHPIQIGSYRGRADVVLIDDDDLLAAIIECKRSGYEGTGPDQLKSYLSATDTPLGVFANEINPANWQFYENRGQNQFKPIGRSQFETRLLKRGIIRKLGSFVLSFLRRRRDTPPTPPPPNPIDPSTITPDRSNIIHIAGDQFLQNNNSTDLDLSLNGKPYYSEASGFYWAANHHGMPECVPQHVKHIISSEELEIKSTREQLQAQIDELVDEKNGLEAQKREYEREIGQRSQGLARKREELAGLEVQLGAPTETELNLICVSDGYLDFNVDIPRAKGTYIPYRDVVKFRKDPTNWEQKFDGEGDGLLKAGEFSPYYAKFLMVEINFRYMLDLPILKKYWRTWLESMGINHTKFVPKPSDYRSNRAIEEIEAFISQNR